jgi:hypothetical protein
MMKNQSSQLLLYRILGFLLSSLLNTLILSSNALASDLGTGLTAIEEGDDRFRPAAVLHFSTASGFASRFYLYGRNYGPVQERNYLLSAGKRFDISGKSLQGIVGIAAMADTTVIKFKDYPQDNSSYTTTNFGGAFGLHWIFLETNIIQLRATWDAHVFPAGSGFLFLANARKSGIGITATTVF